MKGKIYIIVIFILMIFIISSCSSKESFSDNEKPKILGERIVEAREENSSIECKKITYLSDGLEVVGYLVVDLHFNSS